MMFSVLTGLIVLLYSMAIFRRWRAWRRMPVVSVQPDNAPETFISVIVPVRNEAGHIGKLLHDLNGQVYPAALFEVLVIDDHSDDATAAIVEAFKIRANYELQLIRLSGSG
jgi:poly-beta-1,6-N-acetyl-D-glucosamine synthase